MAPATRDEDEGLELEPPPAALSAVAAVADRWARTTGQTWALEHRVDVDIVRMRPEHAEQVLAIYQAGLDIGNASFETCVPDWDHFDACHLAKHRFVACDRRSGSVLGWVALAPVSTRAVYRGVAEESIYVRPDVRRAGVGSALIEAVIASSSGAGIWTLQAGIFPENLASIALHRSHGFRVVGVRERVAEHLGRWRNMLLLEHHDGCAENFRKHPLTVLRHEAHENGGTAARGCHVFAGAI